MKYLIALAAVLPGAALAHGGHAPMPEAAHGLSHATPLLGVLLAAAVGLVALVRGWRP